jgi:hypothetical protein
MSTTSVSPLRHPGSITIAAAFGHSPRECCAYATLALAIHRTSCRVCVSLSPFHYSQCRLPHKERALMSSHQPSASSPGERSHFPSGSPRQPGLQIRK